MKKMLLLLVLFFFACGAPYNYKSPLGLWTRPHPDQPDMPYDTLAYRALWKGDPEAMKQLYERDNRILAEKQKEQLEKKIQRQMWIERQNQTPIEERLRRIEETLKEIEDEQFRQRWEKWWNE